jgi:hypothetical protein
MQRLAKAKNKGYKIGRVKGSSYLPAFMVTL